MTALEAQSGPGSEEELQKRLGNFDEHVKRQKERRKVQDDKRQDLANELATARKTHVELVTEQGELAGEAKVRLRCLFIYNIANIRVLRLRRSGSTTANY